MTTIPVVSGPTPMPRKLRRIGAIALALGVLLVVPAALVDLDRFLANWLVLFVFVLNAGMGALFLVALEYTVNARWSVPFRRICEHLAGLVPASLILVIPVLLGLHHLYEWTHVEVVAGDPILARKAAYLNIPFFLGRLAMYFLVWLLFYRLFVSLSLEQDRTGDQKLTWRGIRLGPVFMIVFAITMSFAAIDLLMSLSPHWFSSIFGPYVALGSVVAGLALITLVSAQLKMKELLPEAIGPDHFYNLGALLLGLNTLWVYMAFAQFLLIWYSNLPVELAWFVRRQEGGWLLLSLSLIVIHFVVPFLALLSRSAKMDLQRLRWVSIWILAAHGLHLYWIVLPSVPHLRGGPFSWMDLGFPLVALGLGIFVWLWRTSRAPLVAARDPRLEAGLGFHL